MPVPVIILGSIALAVGAAIVGVYLYEKRRTERMGHVCGQLGLAFSPKGDPGMLDGLAGFDLFTDGYSKTIKNVMHGETPRAAVTVFDYQYIVRVGKTTRQFNQTVIYFRSMSLSLPGFALRPEGLLHKIGQAFGYQDIDFALHPEFSRRFLLRGADENAVRDVLGDHALSHFERQDGITLEAEGDQLIYYRYNKRVAPDRVHAFMEEGFRVFELFAR